jgi:glycosyltransferase involved in cell wall biosynthesis
MTRVLTVSRGTSSLGVGLDGETASIQEVRAWFRGRAIFDHLLRYDEVRVRVQGIEAMPRPFATAVAIRALSRGSCVFQDDQDHIVKIGLRTITRLALRAASDFLARGALLKRVESAVRENRRSHAPHSLELTSPALYLRTDITFGLISGGSVGHIAGVVNNLVDVASGAILATTDWIRTTRPEVTTWIISPDGRFRDFTELPLLAFTDVAYEQVLLHLGDTRPAFIYQRYGLENFTGARLAETLEVPFVLEYNGSEVWIQKVWSGTGLTYPELATRIEMFNFQRADLIVVVSEVLAAELIERGLNQAKILVNPNGVDVNRFRPDIDGSRTRAELGLSANTVAIGFVGTFGPWHGAEVLAEAFVEVARALPDARDHVRLVLIGDGARLPDTRRIIREGGVESETIFVGRTRQEDAPRYLAACDVLVSPHVPNSDGTRFFGSPTKLFEYMAMGKAIVASNLEQIGDVLEDDRTALLVKPGSVDELVRGLTLLMKDPALRERLGRAAREEAVAKHTWRDHTRRTVDRLQAVLANQRA